MGSNEYQDVPDRSTTVSIRVIRKVASALDVDPLDLDPLYEIIDPDCLESLLSASTGPRRDGRVEFTMNGCDVTVYETERIELTVPGDSQRSVGRDESSSVTDARDGRLGADD